MANSSKYGLGAGIWTKDLSRAHRVAAQIQTGLCWVNTHHRNDPSSPWCVLVLSTFHSRTKGDFILFCLRGGMKESGIGRENGIEAFEACKFHIPSESNNKKKA